MNNTINRIKKRTDILAEYIVERVERLERENKFLRRDNEELFRRGKQHYLMLREWEMPCGKVLESISKITKSPNGEIVVVINECNHLYYGPEEPFYPLIEKLLKEYEKKVEFERVLEEAKKDIELAPITPLTKGDKQ